MLSYFERKFIWINIHVFIAIHDSFLNLKNSKIRWNFYLMKVSVAQLEKWNLIHFILRVANKRHTWTTRSDKKPKTAEIGEVRKPNILQKGHLGVVKNFWLFFEKIQHKKWVCLFFVETFGTLKGTIKFRFTWVAESFNNWTVLLIGKFKHNNWTWKFSNLQYFR